MARRSRLVIGGALVVSMLVLGVAGYVGIERWSVFEALYMTVTTVTTVVEGELAAAVGGRVMRRRIGRMKDHYILCGFGRVGEEIAREFVARGIPFVVVDNNPEALARAERHGYLREEGDAT